MPTYVYEVVDAADTDAADSRFEVRQSMSEAALTHHPVTGRPVRRVISGGAGPLLGTHSLNPNFSDSPLPPLSGGCGSGCDCH